jgi:small subunit ribosomal protein S17
MNRSSRKLLVGKVVSTKNKKTITVEVENSIKHPLYGKRFKKHKKFSAHDEKNKAKLNDVVQIMETRPYSKSKKFRLEKIIKKIKEGK